MYDVLAMAVMTMMAPAHPGSAGYKQSAGCQGGTAYSAGCQGGMAYQKSAGCSGGMAYGASCSGGSAYSAGCSGGSAAAFGPVRRILAARAERVADRRAARAERAAARAHRFSSAVPIHSETIYYRETIYTERLRTLCG